MLRSSITTIKIMRSIFSVIFFLTSSASAIAQAHLYSDTSYQVSKNKSEIVTIQNSFPKGGGYTDPTGKKLGYVVFWTRVMNKTDTPLELMINFPADSFTTLLRPGSVFKIFLPPDTMKHEKEKLYDFGATGLKSFLDAGVNKPTRLHITINPKEERFFYVGMLILSLPPGNGAMRTGLVLKGNQLFYRVRLEGEPESALVPCGQIVFNK
jgi:hypothetical protein